ncbi:IgGFc-binding protein [Labilithrix luteola]|nr:IgGFc-binding protein [Labilithrix luteola]
MKNTRLGLLAGIAGLLVVVASCSSSRSNVIDDGLSFETDGESSPDGGCEKRRCSPDLRKVLSACDDSVVRECGPTEGCADGTCVPACESASRSQGSIGCSFWTTPAPAALPSDAKLPGGQRVGGIRMNTSCFAAFIANTWTTPVTLRAEYGAHPLDISKSTYRFTTSAAGTFQFERLDGAIPAGEVAVVFLNQDDRPVLWGDASNQEVVNVHTDCPLGTTAARRGRPSAEVLKSEIYDAFHISTDLPVSAYSIFPYGGAASFTPSATLLLPTSAWGTNYLVVEPFADWASLPSLQVVAHEDDTEVRIRPRVTIEGAPGVGPILPEQIGVFRLGKGQVLELVQNNNLGGSVLETTHPVGVFGGAGLINVPKTREAADTAQQQISPISQWGSSYAAVGHRARGDSGDPGDPTYWQIVGAEDGTVLEYAPFRPVGAPEAVDRAGIVAFTSDRPFSVKSQNPDHPFHLSTYMSGGRAFGGEGDPDFVDMIPVDQFLDHYVFFVDHTYPNSSVTLVRKRGQGGFEDVTLDCAGVLDGWLPLGSNETLEYVRVDLTRDSHPASVNGKECGYGRREASSRAPFSLHVWGTSRYASYGFPGGAGTRPVSSTRIEVR